MASVPVAPPAPLAKLAPPRMRRVFARERVFVALAEEVLGRLGADEQQALGTLALLPAADTSLAAELTGRDDAVALLERLAATSVRTRISARIRRRAR